MGSHGGKKTFEISWAEISFTFCICLGLRYFTPLSTVGFQQLYFPYKYKCYRVGPYFLVT